MFPRTTLKGHKEVAFRSMMVTERSLGRNKDHGKVYQAQIEDMVERGVAHVVPAEELELYDGTVSHI